MATITIGNIHGIVFDLDGTLLDSVEAHVESWIKALEKHGYREIDPIQLTSLIGLPGETIINIVAGPEALKEYKSIRKAKDKVFAELIKEGSVRLYRDVVDTLHILKDRGYKMGLATSTPSYILEELLNHLDIKRYFHVIIPGDKVKRGKPDPEIFLKAFDELEINPKYGVVVGDSIYDIKPGKEIGALTILVDYRGIYSPGTWEEEPDIVIKKVSDLIKIL